MVRIKREQSGFSLIELMIAVAIIGILAALAYPSYQKYVQRTKKAEVQTEMLDIANMMFNYKNANGSFAGATVASIYGRTVVPAQGVATYNLAFDPSPTLATGWTLTATPVASNSQVSTGILCLNDQGQRFWAKDATKCILSPNSSWDGH